MSTYISPEGNPEVWEEKPQSYFTEAEWAVLNTDTAPQVPVENEPTFNELLKLFDTKVQDRLDTFARTRTYANINVAASYCNSTIEVYRIEGLYALKIRDETWYYSNSYLGAIQRGEATIPTWKEYEAKLDENVPLEWPNENIHNA